MKNAIWKMENETCAPQKRLLQKSSAHPALLYALVGLDKNSGPNLAIVIRLVIAQKRDAPIFRQQISGYILHSRPFSQIKLVGGDPGLSYEIGFPRLFVRAP